MQKAFRKSDSSGAPFVHLWKRDANVVNLVQETNSILQRPDRPAGGKYTERSFGASHNQRTGS